MKIRYQNREHGAVLVYALLLAVIIGVTLASYLVLAGVQHRSVARSQSWNGALDLAEAGIEEALQHMNTTPDDLSVNGWGASAAGTHGPVSRTMANGRYSVLISTNPIMTIYATGQVAAPISGTFISRVVKVTTLRLPLFNVALAAVEDIDMNGKGAATDSWNSHDPNLSTNGQYDPSKTSTNGHAASEGGIVDIGNHTIVGNLYLGPDASYEGNTGMITGTIYYDYNIQLPDAELPSTTWLPAPVAGNVHTFTVSGDYVVSDSKAIVVEPGVIVRIKVTTSNFSPSSVQIHGGTTNSGTLTVYQISGSMAVAGNSSPNGSGRPENLWYYGLPGVTSISLSGTSTFIGVIYAPSATLALGGGGASYNLIGSSITRTVTLNGHYLFHYDESLANLGPARGHVPTSWQEL